MTDTASLDERYGRTSTRKRRDRTVLWLGGILVAIVVGAWLVWAGLQNPSATLVAESTGFTVNDEFSTDVHYTITTNPGTEVSCALQVLNPTKAIVGWTVVDIPASETRSRTFTTTVRTTELGVSGLIYRCWTP